MEQEKKEKAAKPKAKMTFQEALYLVHKDLSERVVKKQVKDASGKKKTVETKGAFDHNEVIDVEFTEKFHSHEPKDVETLGLLTGLAYVKMGIAKKL